MISLPPRYSGAIPLPGGGMSDTLLCDDANLKRKVVIKALKHGVAPSKLLDELTALSAIRSKHVVQVLDVIYDGKGDICGFVEEYIEGPTLACPPVIAAVDAMKLIYPIACGIADIHEHGRLHRDIKPDNMKFDSEGTLKVFDFGLAKLETNGGTSVLYYSSGFTAPEAFQKNAQGVHEYSRALDVFAFGATALWLLDEGKLPPQFLALPATIPSSAWDFGALPAHLPHAVAACLNSALSYDPAQRPSMAQVRDLLAKHLLKDRHRMLMTFGSNVHTLDVANKISNLSYGSANISIAYDGFDFKVATVSGSVSINNISVSVGMALVGASVIVMQSQLGKISVTADVSHPEVMR